MTKKLYVSAPENIRNSDDYTNLKKKLAYQVSKILKEDYQPIDNLPVDDSDDSNSYYTASDLLNLYRGLHDMSASDLVVFYPKWGNDRQCIIEHDICVLYNLDYYTLDLSSYQDEANREACEENESNAE